MLDSTSNRQVRFEKKCILLLRSVKFTVCHLGSCIYWYNMIRLWKYCTCRTIILFFIPLAAPMPLHRPLPAFVWVCGGVRGDNRSGHDIWIARVDFPLNKQSFAFFAAFRYDSNFAIRMYDVVNAPLKFVDSMWRFIYFYY